MKLVRPFSEAMLPLENLNDERAGEDSSATRGAFGVNQPDKAVISGVGEHALLIYIVKAAAHRRRLIENWMQRATIYIKSR